MIQVYSLFMQSISLELAISSLEQNGISRESIFAVPLNERKISPRLFDTLHHADGFSFISKGAALSTGFSVIGASVGFRLEWGPIYWGLIGASVGFTLGVTIDLLIYAIKKNQRKQKTSAPNVIIIVECEEAAGDTVEHILWHHLATGVARIRVE